MNRALIVAGCAVFWVGVMLLVVWWGTRVDDYRGAKRKRRPTPTPPPVLGEHDRAPVHPPARLPRHADWTLGGGTTRLPTSEELSARAMIPLPSRHILNDEGEMQWRREPQ